MNRAAGAFPLGIGLVVGVVLTGVVLPFVVESDGPRHTPVAAGAVAQGPGSGPATRTGAAPALLAPTASGAGEADPSATADAATAAAASTPTTVGATGAAAPRERGVTDTTVKVGFLLLDVGQLSRFGVSAPVVDPALLRGAYQAFVDELNERGGFHGRTIEASYRTFEITSADSQRAACLGLTQDEGVFAVVGEFPDRSANLCVTKENGAIFLTPALAGIADDVFDAAGGLLFSLYPRGSRQMVDLADDLHRSGVLAGKRIGIVNQRSNDPAGAMGDILQSTLQRHGHSVVRRAEFSADNADAASQVPVEVQQMRAQGTEVVLLLANALVSAQFTQAADAQGWRPAYFMTDWNYLNTDTAAQNFPKSMDGALGLTYGRAYEWRTNIPEPPMTRTCIDVYRRRTGKSTTRQELSYQSVSFACAHAGQLRAGLGGAGRELTRRTFVTALQQAGEVPETAAWWGPGAYRPGKADYVDSLRTQHWRASCRCWHPTGPFRQP